MLLFKKLKVVAATIAVGVAGLVAARNGPLRADGPPATARSIAPPRTAEVVRGRLPVTLKLRGALEAADPKDLYSIVPGQNTIISIIPEGTKVKKGDVVCQLDSAALEDALVNQTIAARSAEADYQNARLAREVAEIAVTEYAEGLYKQGINTVLGEIALAESALKQAEDRAAQAKTMRDKGTISGDEFSNAAIALQRARFALEQAQNRRSVLEKFTRDKAVKKLQYELEKARSDEMTKQGIWEFERAREAKLKHQVSYCTLRAPADGVVIYANSAGAGRVLIEEGATVRERQKVFTIFEVGGPLKLSFFVPESAVSRVKPGQSVRVTVEAFPEKALAGKVVEVASLPSSASASRLLYPARARIEGGDDGLRPGMTATAEFDFGVVEDALTVPAGAVARFGEKSCVAVKRPDGAVEWREVTVGASNAEVVEIKEGLREGEFVLLGPTTATE